MKENIKASIIIINWNGQSVISPCLDSIKKQTFKDYEAILVDNASADGSPEYIQINYPWVKMIRLDHNYGFATANNIGLGYCNGKYIACLNNDTVVAPEWLERLVTEMDNSEDVGICASKMIVYGTAIIDSAGDGCTTVGRGFKRGEGCSSQEYRISDYSFGACAGAALYRKIMIDEIGFFDDDFFLIHEDTDLNFRAKLSGWKCKYVNDAIVYHKVRSSIKFMSDIAIYYTNRNVDFVWIKNMPLWLMVRFFHHKFISELGSLFYFGIKHRSPILFLKSKCDVMKLIPKMLRKRKKIQGNLKINRDELTKELTSIFTKDILIQKILKLLNDKV